MRIIRKAKVLFFVDSWLFISALIVVISGFIIWFVPGGKLRRLFGLPRGRWNEIHEWAGAVLTVFVIIHFILHWDWITSMVKVFLRRRKEKRLGVG